MSLLKRINGTINNWLFKEEIEQTEQRRAEGLPVTPEEHEAVRKEDFERMERVTKAELEKIQAEDHTKMPSQSDINRYYNYHENYIANMKSLEERVGNLWTKAPDRVINLELFNDKAREEGWSYLRGNCGLPTGDISKPRTPWVTGQVPTWNTSDNQEPEIHTEKPRKRGM
jgi:hypothetical protein